MNHKDRKNSYKRSAGGLRPNRKFILYVEGRNTEKSYFDLLKKSNCKIIPVTNRGQGISSCVDFVNDSDMAWNSLPKDEKAKYDQKWLVFDGDGRKDFDAGIKLARNKGFGVAFSNMCIEYWFMLHFYDHDGSAIPMTGDSHSAAQINMINKYIRRQNKKTGLAITEYDSGSKKVEDDFFDHMMAEDPITRKSRVVLAFERAKAIHEYKKTCGAESRESVTTIYELLYELGVIEKNNGVFTLFRK